MKFIWNTIINILFFVLAGAVFYNIFNGEVLLSALLSAVAATALHVLAAYIMKEPLDFNPARETATMAVLVTAMLLILG